MNQRTPGKWEALSLNWPDGTPYSHGWRVVIADVCSEIAGDLSAHDAKLIAAAGTSANAIDALGFDGQLAIEELPDFLRRWKAVADDECPNPTDFEPIIEDFLAAIKQEKQP